MALIYRNNVLKIITCRSIGRVVKMNGMSCIQVSQWWSGVNLNVIIDVLKSYTIIILYACHDTMILHLHYRIVRFLRYVLKFCEF